VGSTQTSGRSETHSRPISTCRLRSADCDPPVVAAVLFATVIVSTIAIRADCGENERQQLHWRFPQRGEYRQQFLTSGELSEIAAASAAVRASGQHQHGLQGLTRPSPVRATEPCPSGLWPFRLFGCTPAPEAGTSARHLTPSRTLPRTAHIGGWVLCFADAGSKTRRVGRWYIFTPTDESRDELLASYEDGVWTFIAIVGCILIGITVWVAFVL
jgi:hypothetical protein